MMKNLKKNGSWIIVLMGTLTACGVDQRLQNPELTSPVVEGEGAEHESEGVAGATGGGTLGQTIGEVSGNTFVLGYVRLSSGDRVHVHVVRGTVHKIESAVLVPKVPYLDASGLFIFPAFVDSHVHLSYFPVAESLAQAGVLAAVDLAAPLATLNESSSFLEVLSAGPMITSVSGYPTQSWGRDGYGLEVEGVTAAADAVRLLLESGARLIKVPLDGEDSLSDDEVAQIVETAHQSGVVVAAHALTEAAASRGARLGCDVLAHTPVEPLSEQTIAAWSRGTVISTLSAFGASDAAIVNLKLLHEGGTRVLYGTDLGNSRTAGIAIGELALLERAGLTRSEALASGTEEAARFWGLKTGLLQEGGDASFLLLNANPELDAAALVEPSYVFRRGVLLKN